MRHWFFVSTEHHLPRLGISWSETAIHSVSSLFPARNADLPSHTCPSRSYCSRWGQEAREQRTCPHTSPSRRWVRGPLGRARGHAHTKAALSAKSSSHSWSFPYVEATHRIYASSRPSVIGSPESIFDSIGKPCLHSLHEHLHYERVHKPSKHCALNANYQRRGSENSRMIQWHTSTGTVTLQFPFR